MISERRVREYAKAAFYSPRTLKNAFENGELAAANAELTEVPENHVFLAYGRVLKRLTSNLIGDERVRRSLFNLEADLLHRRFQYDVIENPVTQFIYTAPDGKSRPMKGEERKAYQQQQRKEAQALLLKNEQARLTLLRAHFEKKREGEAGAPAKVNRDVKAFEDARATAMEAVRDLRYAFYRQRIETPTVIDHEQNPYPDEPDPDEKARLYAASIIRTAMEEYAPKEKEKLEAYARLQNAALTDWVVRREDAKRRGENPEPDDAQLNLAAFNLYCRLARFYQSHARAYHHAYTLHEAFRTFPSLQTKSSRK